MSFERACALADVPTDEALGVTLGDQAVAVARDGDEVFALEDVCSHANVALSEGDVDYKIVTGTEYLEDKSPDAVGDLARSVDGIISQTKGTVASFETTRDVLRDLLAEMQKVSTSARFRGVYVTLSLRCSIQRALASTFCTRSKMLWLTLAFLFPPERELTCLSQRFKETMAGTESSGKAMCFVHRTKNSDKSSAICSPTPSW